MIKLNKVEAYIIISKLVDIGEIELADRLMKVLIDETIAARKLQFSYNSTIKLEDDRGKKSTLHRAKKQLKKQRRA